MRYMITIGAAALIIPLADWLAFAQTPEDKGSALPVFGLPGPVMGHSPSDPLKQEPKSLPDLPQEPVGEKKILPPPPNPDLKDPTAGSQKLKDILNVGKAVTAGQPAFKLPNLVLRGRIISKDRPAAVLLEMDGKLYVVGKDSILPGPGNTTLRVDEINSLEVRIEVAPFKELLSLR